MSVPLRSGPRLVSGEGALPVPRGPAAASPPSTSVRTGFPCLPGPPPPPPTTQASGEVSAASACPQPGAQPGAPTALALPIWVGTGYFANVVKSHRSVPISRPSNAVLIYTELANLMRRREDPEENWAVSEILSLFMAN